MLKKSPLVIVLVFFISGCAEMGQYQTGDIRRAPAYRPYQGIKKRIAVTSFVNKVRGIPGNQNIGEGMSEMLITELIKTGRFVVVERQALHDILSEQELGQTGLIRKETVAKVGQVLGAQIIVRGVVSEFEEKTSGGGGDFTYEGYSFGVRTSYAHVAVDIRMIDSTTGQILHSHNAVGKAESSGLTFGYANSDFDFKTGGFQKTPMGQATRQAIQSAVNFIINKMKQMPFTAKVIKSKEINIYINAGSLMNVKPGDRFNAFSKGEEFVDPDTGLSLGSEETFIGAIEIKDVKEKYSIAKLVSGKGTLKRGDIIKGGIEGKFYDISAATRPYYDRGKTSFNQGNYKGAEAEFRKALNQEPNSPLYIAWLGNSIESQGRIAESIDYYRRYVQLAPDDSYSHRYLADALKEAGKLEEAKTEYEAVLRINPNDKKARERILLIPGDILFRKKDYAGAEAEYKKAVEQLPDFSLAHNGVGAALTWQGKWAESIPYYKKAVQLSPNDSVFHGNLANALRETGKLEEAKKEYEAVLRLNPNDKKVREQVLLIPGKILLNKKDYAGAEAKYRKAVEQLPNSAEAHNYLGTSLSWQSKNTEAIPHYQKAVQLKPNYALYHSNLAFELEKTGKFDEAKSEFEAALRLNPNDKWVRKEAALLKIILLEDKEDKKGAKAAFQEALKVMPNETLTLFELDRLRATRKRAANPKGQYGWLGVSIKVFGPEDREKYLTNNVAGVPAGDIRGMLVVGVNAGSAAEAAGIQSVILRPGAKGNNPEDFKKLGDIITEIDGHSALGNLLSLLATKKPGDTVSLKVIRDGKPRTITVTLKARPK